MKVMIVDDDPTTLTVLGAVLQSRGHEVIQRDAALGTTLAILREKPEVVVLDVRMPGLGGDRLASLIDQQSLSRPIVIFHSSLPAAELESLVERSAAAGYVEKRGSPERFIEQFDRIVMGARQRLRTEARLATWQT